MQDFLLGVGIGSGTWLGATDTFKEGTFFTERKLRYGHKDENGEQVQLVTNLSAIALYLN